MSDQGQGEEADTTTNPVDMKRKTDYYEQEI